MTEKPKRFVFDLADADRETLEALRQLRGERSQAATLRAIVREAHRDLVASPGYQFRLRQGLAAIANTSRAKVTDPGMDKPFKSRLKGEWKAP